MIKMICAFIAIALAVGGFALAFPNLFDNKKDNKKKVIFGTILCCASAFILLCIALSYVL